MASQLPDKYKWLYNEGHPAMLVEAIKHFGELELKGKDNNPSIMKWAKEVGVSGWYPGDDVSWCGLFVGVCALRAEYPHNKELLAARSWLTYGEAIPKNRWMLWDILVFNRAAGGPKAGHVAFYVGETKDAFLIYGGNQSDSVSFTWISKSRLIGARRPLYKYGEPDNVRRILMTKDGDLSTNEA
jgi:uncharacterized protein (TIGR02594 family)